MDLFKLDEILHEMEDDSPLISKDVPDQKTTGGRVYHPVQMHDSAAGSNGASEVSTFDEALDDFGELLTQGHLT